ncbi:hypothetical protein [Nitrospirillum iridis]|uniref:Uncharacterized protein n=1 Tax=Nitrospirillum iridis TaxID=765888 RepID=A0A7X0B3T6_9PROT|nr:hypothetical protein [Nitrospirillum iridis]MBB6255214.1 hypothetical protein [Nitrospirillum iridis]
MITADDVSRIIMLLKGVMDHGGPFWCYVALKPSQFEAFKAAEAAGAIDLYKFDDFGEIVVSAEGEMPPYIVTEEVARMYGTDPRTFFRDIDPLAEIAERMRVLGHGQEPDPNPPSPSSGSRWADRFGKKS